MFPIRSRNSLSTRLKNRQVRAVARASTPSRPCLAAIDQLEDRLLLSAATSPVVSDPNGSDAQVLVGLLTTQFDSIQSEISMLKIKSATGGTTAATLHKLSTEFLKIDSILNTYGTDLSSGTLDKGAPANLKIKSTNEFLKIDDDAGTELLPAVQSVDDELTAELATLTSDKDGYSTLSQKDKQQFNNISLDVANLAGTIMNYGLEVFEGKPHLQLDETNALESINKTWLKIDTFVDKLGETDQAVLLPAVQSLKVDFQTLLTDSV
jgi:hypothetical protein